MQATVNLPKAFSVRDDREFFPMQHVMARMNPKLMVVQVATGRHVDGGCTVFWGLVYEADQPPAKQEVETALREAGFDFTVSDPIRALQVPNGKPEKVKTLETASAT